MSFARTESTVDPFSVSAVRCKTLLKQVACTLISPCHWLMALAGTTNKVPPAAPSFLCSGSLPGRFCDMAASICTVLPRPISSANMPPYGPSGENSRPSIHRTPAS